MPDRPAVPLTQASENTDRPARSRRAVTRSWSELTAPVAAGDLPAVSTLRRLAASALAQWGIGQDKTDDVVLVLSELVTNALVHTDGPARVRLRLRAGRIALEVADTSTRQLDLETGPDEESEPIHGYGLALVASTLADTFTVALHPRCGKTVTATFGTR
jgi:anti-sigma regulatory factor (Ser/Thr protein kinase)